MGRTIRLLSFTLGLVVFAGGCNGPRTYLNGIGGELIHCIGEAEVFDDYLSITGVWTRPWKVSEYGVRVIKAEDDKGRTLKFKSFQFAVFKTTDFELEFTRPEDDARSVTIDVVFVIHRKMQRVTQTMPLRRPGHKSYNNMRDRFERPPSIHAEW